MIQTNWFDRKFPPVTDNGLLPNIIERLTGTHARLTNMVSQIHDLENSKPGKPWSIKKEIGHLLDLEPLWLKRVRQIIGGNDQMEIADLTNRKTHEADHDARNMHELIAAFAAERKKFTNLLKQVKDEDLLKSTPHPRLGTPMKIIDLAFFVAEHDDHHLVKITTLSE